MIDKYEVQIRGCKRGSRTWRRVVEPISETYLRVPNLLSGFAYEFRVRAGNIGGFGLYSPSSSPFLTTEGKINLNLNFISFSLFYFCSFFYCMIKQVNFFHFSMKEV